MRVLPIVVCSSLLGTACDVRMTSEGTPTPSSAGTSLEVATPEAEPDRGLLVVGQQGSATVDLWWTGRPPERFHTTFAVTNPAVMEVTPRSHRAAVIRALEAGSVELLATVEIDGGNGAPDTVTHRHRVDVVNAPLPVTEFTLDLWHGVEVRNIMYDSAGSLASVELVRNHTASLALRVLRDRVPVWPIAYAIGSSDTTVARVMDWCAPPASASSCGMPGVNGVRTGEAIIAVQVRDIVRRFRMTVVP